MSSSAARQHWRETRTKLVIDFCKKYDMSLVPLNNGYQLRIENLVDIYPTNGRWCILQSGERGDWHTYRDLRGIMLKALPDMRALQMYDKPPANPFGEPVSVPVPPTDTWRLQNLNAKVERSIMDKLTSGHLAVIGVVLFIIAGATELFIVGLAAAAVWLFALYRWFTKERKAK